MKERQLENLPPENPKPGETWGAYIAHPDGFWSLREDYCVRCGELLRGTDAVHADHGVPVTCGLCRDDMQKGR